MSDLRKAASDAIRIMAQHQGTWRHTSFDFVIADLKAALAETEQSEPVVRWDSDGWGDLLVSDLPDGTLLYTAHPPRREPLTTEKYTELAHRIASKYTHRSDPAFTGYTFLPHTLEQFVRSVEAAHQIGVKP